ncbi:MAG: hypothetical protein GYA87_02985 [Christensenellaceae bacterium]|nr:hypothetical protein [Christensenellaceae bacterium]
MFKHYSEYLEDINIAKNSIDKSLLRKFVDVNNLWCDLYCLPSYNNQTYYCEVYKKENDVYIIYAKNSLYYHDLMCYIKTRTFKEAFDARISNPPSNIICGIVKASDNFIMLLKKYVNNINPNYVYNYYDHNVIIIDGIIQCIRVYNNNNTIYKSAYYNFINEINKGMFIDEKEIELANNFFEFVNNEIGLQENT